MVYCEGGAVVGVEGAAGLEVEEDPNELEPKGLEPDELLEPNGLEELLPNPGAPFWFCCI